MTVNLTRIYTRLGDGGETHLGDMSRVPKTHPRIEAYGTVDELNAQLGVALAQGGLPDALRGVAARVQNDLFDVGADISVPEGGERERLRVDPGADGVARGAPATRPTPSCPALKSFVLPGGTLAAAQLHVCRTVCRRAERRAIACGEERQRRVRALPQPALATCCSSSRARRTWRRRRRAAVGAGTLPLSRARRRRSPARRRRTSCWPTRRRRPPRAARRRSAGRRGAEDVRAPAPAPPQRSRSSSPARSAAVASTPSRSRPAARRARRSGSASRASAARRRVAHGQQPADRRGSGRSRGGATITSASARLITAVVCPLGHAAGPMKCPAGLALERQQRLEDLAS